MLTEADMKEVRDAADDLIGTCETEDFDGWSVEKCTAFDELAFRCEQCEWWHATDELNDSLDDRQLCNQCNEESDDE